MSVRSQGIFRSRDGTAIYYEVRGEGRPIVLCYGLACRIEHWRHQIKHLEGHYQVIALDYRGHHRSSVPQNDRHLTLEWCAYDVQDLVKHLGLSEAVCLGHSMGLPIAARFAILEPTIVKGTVFICGTMSNPFAQMFHSNRLDTLFTTVSSLYELAPGIVTKVWRKLTSRNYFNLFLTSKFGFNADLSDQQDILQYVDGVNQAPFSVFHRLLSDYHGFDGHDLLKQIEVPTLVIAGGADHITPLDVQRKIASLLPNGHIEVIPQGSHNAHTDLPDLVNEKIDEFLTKIGYQA